MTLELYLWCTISAMIGGMLQTAFKVQSLQAKAKLSNVEFTFRGFLRDDWARILANQLTILLALIVVDEFVKVDSKVMEHIKLVFAFIGYVGSDIALRFFSVANKRLNAAIDFKTTEIDKINNTIDTPTPAVLPTDKPKP